MAPSKRRAAKTLTLIILTFGILEIFRSAKLKNWIIKVDFKNIGNWISQAIFDASFYRDVGDSSNLMSSENGPFHPSINP
jgi:hypothetical protein